MTNSEIILYQTEDGQTKIDVRLEEESVWLSQKEMSVLFQKERSVITKHINNVFKEGELDEKSNVQILHISSSDRPVKYYNLDVIISVGYRVKSHRGTQFRIWATKQLREYLIKGFVLNDEKLKETGHTNQYFDELLERIRDIRSSEKIFYAKIRDIYTTAIDYDPNDEESKLFFKTVQNKMHWAIHGHTASEIVYQRSDSEKQNMGLTTWKNALKGKIRKTDVSIAKNYLTEDELIDLNLIVEQYLSFAELRARNREPMYMSDWLKKLNDFMTLNEKEILEHAGRISAKMAKELADAEYDKYRKKRIEAEDAKVIKELEAGLAKLEKK
jgi:hypothetical protein